MGSGAGNSGLGESDSSQACAVWLLSAEQADWSLLASVTDSGFWAFVGMGKRRGVLSTSLTLSGFWGPL